MRVLDLFSGIGGFSLGLERAGMRTGDIIREINRKPVKDVKDFERLTSQLTSKSSVLLLLNRGTATIFLSITGER